VLIKGTHIFYGLIADRIIILNLLCFWPRVVAFCLYQLSQSDLPPLQAKTRCLFADHLNAGTKRQSGTLVSNGMG